MDRSVAYVSCGLLSFILALLFLCYRNAMRKVEGFPFFHAFPVIAYYKVTGKLTTDVPLTSHIFQALIDICKEYSKEGLFMTYLTHPVLMVFSEEAIKFFSNEKAASDKSLLYDYTQELVGSGLLISNGKRWRTHRKIINPAFHLGALKEKVCLFNKYALSLVKDMEKLAEKSSVDLLDVLKSNYFNSLSESMFGLKQSEENRAENLKIFHSIDSAFHMIVQQVFMPWLRLKFFSNILSTGRAYQKDVKEYKSFITKVISDMKKQVASNESIPMDIDSERFSDHLQKSFTYLLLRQHLKDPSFTFQDIHDEVSTMLFAGYDTVTYTTLWCLFMLALHPEVQEKAFNEVQGTTMDDYVIYEDSCNLTYLEAVIMETLRLYPTVPLVGRYISEDVQFGKYKVHKGTTVAFMSFILHRNPDVYSNPEQFEPERFLNGESANRSFIPFSDGSRACIGKKYAIIQMKIFLAHILRNFQISSLDKREDINLCWAIILLPARPIRLTITPRRKRIKDASTTIKKCLNT